MAAESTAQTATTSTEDRKKVVVRQLNGTSFLTLEHVGYFMLVVLLPVLLVVGASAAMQLWQSDSSTTGMGMMQPLTAYIVGPVFRAIDTSTGIMVTAALLVLAPLMYALRRRIAAEYAKRPGYTNRVGYKLPVYTALGLLTAMTVGAFAVMLSVFLSSLVNIGVSGANIGTMYTQQFLPALLAFAVFGMATWYAMWFAKGKDTSKMFVSVVLLLSAVMAITLFVTTLSINHQNKTVNPISPIQPQPYTPQDNTYLY